MGERPIWFWGITTLLIVGWSLAGTVSIIFILNNNVQIGEIIVIASSIVIALLYHAFEWFVERR